MISFRKLLKIRRLGMRASWYAWACYLLVSSTLVQAAQKYETPLSLKNFGYRDNQIPNVLPAARHTSSAPLRTNDFQTLQLNQSNRSMTRIGPWQVSQSGTGGGFGNGPGVTVPQRVYVNPGTNPAVNITASNGESMLVFTSGETMVYDVSSTIGSGMGQSATFQSLGLKFSNPSDSTEWLSTDIVQGNAFFDVFYNNLTPYIQVDGRTSLQEVVVFSDEFPSGKKYTPGTPPIIKMVEGNKFRIKVKDTLTDTTLTYLLYVEPSSTTPSATPTVVFTAYFNNSSNYILKAKNPVDGALFRLAVVQPNEAPQTTASGGQTGSGSLTSAWSTEIGIQTVAPSAASMFVLWPTEFCTNANQTIISSTDNGFNIPYCPWYSSFVNLIARTDYSKANDYFTILMAKKQAGSPAFGEGMNPFVAYFGMLMANYYSDDISLYQSSERSFPTYSVGTPSAAQIEAVYDRYRGCIPTKCEVSFDVDERQYTWSYTTYTTTNGEGSVANKPLIVFPYYKKLSTSSTSNVESNYLVQDPFLYKLYGVGAVDNVVQMVEGDVPNFMEQGDFFPDDLWDRLSSGEKTELGKLMDSTIGEFAPAILVNDNSAVYTQGQVGYEWALTMRYAIYVMQKLGRSSAQIASQTSPIATNLKTMVENWMINRQKSVREAHGASGNGKLPTNLTSSNFFIGDATNGALSADLSAMSNINPGTNFGNAFYNDHILQYCYWLGVAAAIVEWDNLYTSGTPWIAQNFLAATGAKSVKMKYFIDLLWRDTICFDTEDPDFPYHRHQNLFEGHACALGTVPTDAQTNGRNLESLGENFNFWANALNYAQQILNNSHLDESDKKGFPEFVAYCKTNIGLVATGGTRFYKTSNWPYVKRGFNQNPCIGNAWDSLTDSATFFGPGSPPCQLDDESLTFSSYRIDSFEESVIVEGGGIETEEVEVVNEEDFFFD
ncbi:MAG: hypothetical protein S4CHLAM102_16440 [Chlamydiia bacterium]|nr:hypothetical protein [Chlamydiia bacterium]